MTTFRFKFSHGDWKVRLALVALVCGFLGFFACWMILAVGESRVFGDSKFVVPSIERPAAIEAKGHVYFMESNWALAYNWAQRLISFIWGFAAGGGFYIQAREREDVKK